MWRTGFIVYGLFAATLCLTPLSGFAEGTKNTSFIDRFENAYQGDADIIRYRNLVHWSGLVEAYFEKTGQYPLQEIDSSSENGILVRIAQQRHQKFYLQDGALYNGLLDYNQNLAFENVHPISLIRFLKDGLKRDIDERYDIQKFPTSFPTWIHYFVVPDGYLMWTACATCADSDITLRSGQANTINVGSPAVADSSPSFFTYDELLSNATFQSLLNEPLAKQDYVDSLWLRMSRHWQDIFEKN